MSFTFSEQIATLFALIRPEDERNLERLFFKTGITEWMLGSLDELRNKWVNSLLPHVCWYSDYHPKGRKITRYDFEKFSVTFNDGTEMRVYVDNFIKYAEEKGLRSFLNIQVLLAGFFMPTVERPKLILYPTATCEEKIIEIQKELRKANIFIIVMATRNVKDLIEDAALHHKFTFRSRETLMTDLDKRLVMMASWNTYFMVLKFMIKTLHKNCPSLQAILLMIHRPILRRFILHLLVRHFTQAYCASSPDTDICEYLIDVGELLMLNLHKKLSRELNTVRGYCREPFIALLIIQNIIATIRFSITASART
ncbi:uncharacterized protein LOC108681964 [Hyalella azteca]|uniref:Uncharacterized protein LOC108681964 n=1 Tax=Hyalella azteca TaxID=294128 RepID=A0A8B7PMA1_HYAAZ|nr:uncharacterized protein LOC108681964 [Hyalella azteca]